MPMKPTTGPEAEDVEAKIADAPDGVELIVRPLAPGNAHRTQHVRYSEALGLCTQRVGRFVAKRAEDGELLGYERRGEDVFVGDAIPADLSGTVVVEEG